MAEGYSDKDAWTPGFPKQSLQKYNYMHTIFAQYIADKNFVCYDKLFFKVRP